MPYLTAKCIRFYLAPHTQLWDPRALLQTPAFPHSGGSIRADKAAFFSAVCAKYICLEFISSSRSVTSRPYHLTDSFAVFVDVIRPFVYLLQLS